MSTLSTTVTRVGKWKVVQKHPLPSLSKRDLQNRVWEARFLANEIANMDPTSSPVSPEARDLAQQIFDLLTP
jgi:hypothetical protein